MVTSKLALVAALLLLLGCSGKTAGTNTSGEPEGSKPAPETESGTGTATLPPDTVNPGGTGPQYPGTGFRVHEWGTNTVVVGSDGVMQRGLHHEEEDLPSFVYDRTRSDVAETSVNVKMETPVTYFYSDTPLVASAKVDFPQGVLTQWYPMVAALWPPFFKDKGDPVFDRNFAYSSPECKATFTKVDKGFLNWGSVEILPRGEKKLGPAAALDRYTWSHARDVDANSVKVLGQEERFLFYRGLGNFPLNVKITATNDDGGLALANQDTVEKVGAVFVLRVTNDKAAFKVIPAGIAAKGSIAETAPPATQPLEAYAQDLAKAMVTELDKAGLYHDESIAMVKTWARQWFRTPGVRVLYLAPQAWTEKQIPLTVEPKPMEMVRVMVIRVEAITRAQEKLDLAALELLSGDAKSVAQGEAYFTSLGRFAEPRLRRAMAQGTEPSAAALGYLDKIAGANVNLRAGE